MFCTVSHNTEWGKRFMRSGTKPRNVGGRPRKFDAADALGRMQRQIWTSGLSGVSLDGIAKSAGLSRPSLAASFGGKDAIYAQAAAQYVEMMETQMGPAFTHEDLGDALRAAFDTAIGIYTAEGPDGCFVLCTAPAEAQNSPACRAVLDHAIEQIDAVFLRRLQLACPMAGPTELPPVAALLGATLQSIALRARAGWSPTLLRELAAGAVDQALLAVGRARLAV